MTAPLDGLLVVDLSATSTGAVQIACGSESLWRRPYAEFTLDPVAIPVVAIGGLFDPRAYGSDASDAVVLQGDCGSRWGSSTSPSGVCG